MNPTHSPSPQAAARGEPSYVWRAGQARRLAMIQAAAPVLGRWRAAGGAPPRVLENGAGLGAYLGPLLALSPAVVGLEYERERAAQAGRANPAAGVVCGASEHLPFGAGSFDVILSNEVIEHVADDRAAVAEMARALRPGGRLVLFCPNRWYPVEQHGVYWRGRYHFGNIPLVNYLPNALRNKLAPHVRTYTAHSLRRLLAGLPLRIVSHRRIFGGYDNLVRKLGPLGRALRLALHAAERTPISVLGLSHLVVAEREGGEAVGT
jgi:SAM-dependent methyltransferase